MQHRTYDLLPRFPALDGGETPISLTGYVRDPLPVLASDNRRWAALILPGGGYGMVSTLEAEPVALALLAAGIQAFVLEYPVAPDRHPRPLLAAAAALAFLKEHRREFGADRFAVVGFSAGGHLAGTLSNLWHTAPLSEALDLPAERFRPDAAVLSYPVTVDSPKTFENLLGPGTAPSGPLSPLVLDASVQAKTPPTFLWATQSDQMVPVENTLRYAQALQREGVPFELHLFPSGPHAMGLATRETAPGRSYADPHVARWLPLCLEWLSRLPEEGRS